VPELSHRRFRSVLDLGEQFRLHVFEPFFTTKDVEQGTGLCDPTDPYFSLPGTPRRHPEATLHRDADVGTRSRRRAYSLSIGDLPPQLAG
jgi:hypothetical protein